MHVSPGSAKTLARGGGITNHHLIACSLSNISAKNYQNRLMCVEVIVCYIIVVFWDTVYLGLLSFFFWLLSHGTGRVCRLILMIYTSYNMFSGKCVHFVDTAPHLWDQIAPNPNFGGMNRHFSTKHAKYLNFCVIKTTEWIPTKIFSKIKITFSTPKMCSTNPR